MIAWTVPAIRREGIDLIYATDCFFLGGLGAILKRLTGIPLMVGIMANHDLAYETTGVIAYPRLLRYRWVEQWLQRRVLKAADWIEVAAEDSARYVERYGADPAKFIRLPVVKFIGELHFTAPQDRPDGRPIRERLGIPQNRPTLICVSRLRPVKYALDALEAMRVALEATPEAIGIFAGDGELRADMEGLVASWGLACRVHFIGNIDQQSLAALLPGCILVAPLAGMALIEASLAGVPPVVYDVEWHPEFVENGVNGFVVPFRDSHAMGQMAARLLQDPILFQVMSSNTRERALAFADRRAYAEAETAAFNRILRRETPLSAHSEPGTLNG